MTPGQQVSFEPSLAKMLAENFHHASVGRFVFVSRKRFGDPDSIRNFKQRIEAVRCSLVWSNNAEVASIEVELHHVAQEPSQHTSRLGLDCPRRWNFHRVFAIVR